MWVNAGKQKKVPLLEAVGACQRVFCLHASVTVNVKVNKKQILIHRLLKLSSLAWMCLICQYDFQRTLTRLSQSLGLLLHSAGSLAAAET